MLLDSQSLTTQETTALTWSGITSLRSRSAVRIYSQKILCHVVLFDLPRGKTTEPQLTV